MTLSPSELDGAFLTADRFQRDVVEPCRPVIIRGVINRWPAVSAGRQSATAFCDYLRRFERGGTLDVFMGDPEIAGKYYYGQDLKGFNFVRVRMSFRGALDAIIEHIEEDPRYRGPFQRKTIYAGSLPIGDFLPGFAGENAMHLLPASVGGRIWLGHASNVSCHYDTQDNLACVVAGKRRFTLYAPDLIGALYVGPIDHTMAGQPVSLAAASAPDPGRFPLFEKIRDQALVAELEPGDALYLPKLWWHQVEATAPFNGLINYWWDAFSSGPDAPYTTMLLAMIAIAERPPPEREGWRAFFDHYVFRTGGHPLQHLPPDSHGPLGPLKDNYGRIRARVMQMLRGS